jgi:hypothetical protein
MLMSEDTAKHDNQTMIRRLLALAALVWGLSASVLRAGEVPNWRELLTQRLSLYGHRNWIVVADSAYPAQSSPGIETIASHADHLFVLQHVLGAIHASGHVRPVIYTDRELKFVSEQDAPGIQKYREELEALLGKSEVQALPHEDIITKLDQASKTFKILIIKTNLTLPYTSVFIELRAGYWSDAAERHLRAVMAQHTAQ